MPHSAVVVNAQLHRAIPARRITVANTVTNTVTNTVS